jgi:hypothetical protein
MPALRLRDRPTTDLAVLIMIMLIAVIMIIASVTVAIIEIRTGGEADSKTTVNLIGNVVKVLIGAIVGYVAGRATNHHPPG